MNDNELIELAKENAINFHELYQKAERDDLKELCKPDDVCSDWYITSVKFIEAEIQRGNDRDFDWLFNCNYLSGDDDDIDEQVQRDDIIIVLNFEIEDSIYHRYDDSIESRNFIVEVCCLISNEKIIKSIIND
jgi:hypothetical protein